MSTPSIEKSLKFITCLDPVNRAILLTVMCLRMNKDLFLDSPQLASRAVMPTEEVAVATKADRIVLFLQNTQGPGAELEQFLESQPGAQYEDALHHFAKLSLAPAA